MTCSRLRLSTLCAVLLGALGITAAGLQPADQRIQIQINTEEADAVLAIVEKHASQPVTDADWQALFATEPYVRLKKREASLHRDFTDGEFKTFVLASDLARHAPELRRTLDEWKKADLAAAARRVLPYLPAQARIRTKVYPVIKPNSNSFVFETSTDPAIFLYLDSEVTRAKFENTVAHEMHHIGFASIESEMNAKLEGLPPATKTTVQWIGAFGEGFAMLAAAGGLDVHPHEVSTPKERARWDHDMANYNQDLRTLDQFFLDILHGKFKNKDEIDEKAFTFFGVQGPWYTVGYKMAVTIEKHDGRARLIECMTDLLRLLPTYNRAAIEQNNNGGALPLWSSELIQTLDQRH
jgi:Putative zinc dependent peptidase (DUF5700)